MAVTFPDSFNLADYYLFDRLSEGLGDKVAIRYGDRGWTYADVAERARAVARALAHASVVREQRVYIVLPDTPPFAWALFGALAHGAVVAMGNPAAPPDDLAYVVDYSRCAALVTTPAVAAALAPALHASPYVRAVWLVPDTPTGGDPEAPVAVPESLAAAPFEVKPLAEAVVRGRDLPDPGLPPTRRDDLAMWLFTSGSTGRPKAAMHTHRDFAFNTEVYAKRTIGYRRDDVTVSVPRLFFGYATGTNLMFPFAVGATTALFSERPTPESLAAAIARYRPTIVTNVPTMLGKLLDYAGDLDMSSVRFHLSAGEALPPSLLARVTERWGVDVYDGIGSAEMFHIYCTNRPGDVVPGSVGRAVDGYEIRILPRDADGPGADPVPVGETGVMWVRGDSVALGYFQDRDASWRTFHGHWCRTGDLFRRDADGYLWFAGRADDLFKVGGIWVAPLEVEECLLQHPAVALCAVIPVRVDGLVKPKAYVVLRDGVAPGDALAEELQRHVQTRLSKHKYPRYVEFVDDLPKNDRGKVDRKRLIAQAGGEVRV
ncbi:MAG: benzoate-CoA ligase family protein [Deltaproteobacteria bacterium]|nr:MAG: benzoate-CoA ligase family protein [Deltaproteobacteria bacterium]